MARHRQPEELAALKGAKRHDPQRYKKKPAKSELPLGAVPTHLHRSAKKVWAELKTYALKGVLTGSDRIVLETTAVLVAEFRDDPKAMPAAKMGHMIGCLARLGLTPADRQKFGTNPPPEDNPFNEF
jgi:phage terminase small subunit